MIPPASKHLNLKPKQVSDPELEHVAQFELHPLEIATFTFILMYFSATLVSCPEGMALQDPIPTF